MKQQGQNNSTFYVGGPVTSDASRRQIFAQDSLEIPPPCDSEPQSLMGVRFACNALESAMPMIMTEVPFERQTFDFGFSIAVLQSR